MSNIYNILNGKPIPQPDFIVGDSFTSGDGILTHVMDSRWNGDELQYLYVANGIRMWESATAFRRIS